ncbi:MAG: 2TM domain-containing protein [Flavobacteriaceae bacterium]|jgi:hypothetical protein|nr:2TM domain-containing protein [Flavobacteriaceae bacterium]
MENLELQRKKAVQKAQKLKKFYNHAAAYAVINLGLILLNLYTMKLEGSFHLGDFRVIWVISGWGLGLCLNYLNIKEVFFGKDWEEHKMKELSEKKTATGDIYLQRKKTEEKMQEIKMFYYGVVNCSIIIPCMFLMNLFQNYIYQIEDFWVRWVILGLGISLLIQYLRVRDLRLEDLFLGKNWEEKKLKELSEKEK